MSPFMISIYNSIGFAIYCYCVSYIILQKKYISIKKICYVLIPFLITSYIILCLFDSISALFLSGLCAFFFIKIIFNENIYMSLFISLVLHVIKFLNKIVILFFVNNDSLRLLNTYKTLDLTAFFINVIAMFISLIIIFLLRKPARKFIKYISSLKNRRLFFLITTYLSFILFFLYEPPVMSMRTITDIIIIFIATAMGLINISSEMKMESLIKYYKEIFEYSKANEELLTNYKMQVHENKNRLLMIKGMLNGSKKEVKNYIDGILKEINDSKSNSNYWLTELKSIPIPGIRNFINYKLVKLRDLDAEIEVFVSSELKEINASSLSDKDYNQLTTILGVILDNMIESVKEMKEKLISLNIYNEDNKIHGEFVNNFANKIDLTRLNEIGYTTKGEQHGVGLPLVAKITKTNDRFECFPEIIDRFFVQHVIIKLYDKENLQKK